MRIWLAALAIVCLIEGALLLRAHSESSRASAEKERVRADMLACRHELKRLELFPGTKMLTFGKDTYDFLDLTKSGIWGSRKDASGELASFSGTGVYTIDISETQFPAGMPTEYRSDPVAYIVLDLAAQIRNRHIDATRAGYRKDATIAAGYCPAGVRASGQLGAVAVVQFRHGAIVVSGAFQEKSEQKYYQESGPAVITNRITIVIAGAHSIDYSLSGSDRGVPWRKKKAEQEPQPADGD